MRSSSREKILQRIRQSLDKTSTLQPIDILATELPYPTADFSAINSTAENIQDAESIIELFSKAAVENKCTVAQIDNKNHIPNAIKDYLDVNKLPHEIWGWAEFATLPWKKTEILFHTEKIAKQTPVEGTVGLTGTSYAIVDTGTLLIQSHTQKPLQTSLLPETHIAIVYQNQIHYHLHEILTDQLINDEESPQTVLISGPSRTADIEQTLVLGAHGPKNVHLIVVKNSD